MTDASGGGRHKGLSLSGYLNRTPYDSLSRFVTDGRMRLSKGGHPYLVGRSEALGVDISMHYRKRNKGSGRPAQFIVKWPFAGGGPQETSTFVSLLQVEALLRPPRMDVAWIDVIDRETAEVIDAAIVACRDGAGFQGDTQVLAMAHGLSAFYAPGSDAVSATRFDLPSDSRRVVSLCLAAFAAESRIGENDMDGQDWALVEAIGSRLSPSMSPARLPYP